MTGSEHPPDGVAEEPQLIFVGRPCSLCDGAGDCPLCCGAGEIGELVTFNEFRALASLAGPPRPSLV